MNTQALMRRAEKIIKAHEMKKNAARVHIVDANDRNDIDSLNGLVIAITYTEKNQNLS